jgi:hypothetical protein
VGTLSELLFGTVKVSQLLNIFLYSFKILRANLTEKFEVLQPNLKLTGISQMEVRNHQFVKIYKFSTLIFEINEVRIDCQRSQPKIYKNLSFDFF